MALDILGKVKKIAEQELKERVVAHKPLTKKQVKYVQENILPQYEKDCGPCEFNLANYLGVFDK